MLEKDFYQICEETLLDLTSKIEAQDKNSKLDIEYLDGILTIILEENSKTYIINRHAASQKIWYSSPFSGADYFSYDLDSKKWLNSASQELSKKLFLEIKDKI